MTTVPPEHDLLREIPSPSARLWTGLCIILSIFFVFVYYATRQVRWLEDFQVNVVQKNRKASLQLLRLQNDAYLLAIALRDMGLVGDRSSTRSRYPIRDWQPEFDRLRRDMDDALERIAEFAAATPETTEKQGRLQHALADFGRAAEHVFALAREGQVTEARALTETELDSKRAVISEIVARLLVLNDQAQADAAARTNAVYESVRRDILALTAALFLLALSTGLYTFQGSRKIFAKLRHLAEQLEIRSEQLRKLSWKLIDVQESTLRQVARDLHDEFGQILTAVGVMLNRVGRLAPDGPDGDDRLARELADVKRIVEGTLQKVRDQSQIFRPAILDDFGLSQTLEWFTRQFARQSGINVHYRGAAGDDGFAPEVSIHLYRIVQEALSNVARHAKATEAWVELEIAAHELRLEVRDNGVGFDLKASAKRAAGEGIGLMGMSERAEHLNGTLSIESAPERGTQVRVRVPLPRSPAPQVIEKVS